MTSAQVVETSVTNNSSFPNYLHLDDHTIRTTDTPGFKPFTVTRVQLAQVGTSNTLPTLRPGSLFLLFFFFFSFWYASYRKLSNLQGKLFGQRFNKSAVSTSLITHISMRPFVFLQASNSSTNATSMNRAPNAIRRYSTTFVRVMGRYT